MKILHLADSHFQKKRLDECVKCFDYIISVAQKEKPDLIFHAGDLFDKNTLINSEEYHEAIKHIMMLADVAPVIIIRGNHDPLYALDVFEKLDSSYPITYYDEMTILKTSDYNLFMIPYQAPSEIGSGSSIGDIHKSGADLIRERLEEYKKERLKDKPTFVLAHISVLNSRFANSERIQEGEVMLSVDELNLDWIDAVFLGHIHNSQQDIFENTRIRYAGAHYRTRFDEVISPGFFIWNIEEPKIDINFVGTPARDMIQITLDEDGTKKLLASGKFDFPEDSDFKLVLEVPQGFNKIIDKERIMKMAPSSTSLDIKLKINPVSEVRSEKMSKGLNDTEKLEEWGRVAEVQITSSLKKKLDEIVNHDRGIYV